MAPSIKYFRLTPKPTQIRYKSIYMHWIKYEVSTHIRGFLAPNPSFKMSSQESETNKYEFVSPSDSDTDESIIFEAVTNGKVVPQKVTDFQLCNISGNHNNIVDLKPASFDSTPGKCLYIELLSIRFDITK